MSESPMEEIAQHRMCIAPKFEGQDTYSKQNMNLTEWVLSSNRQE